MGHIIDALFHFYTLNTRGIFTGDNLQNQIRLHKLFINLVPTVVAKIFEPIANNNFLT